MYKKLAYFPRKVKILIMMMSDVILLPLALYSAVALRLGTFTPDISKMYWVFIILPFISVPIFLRMGLYRAVIRYMDDKILITVLYCVSLSVLLLMASVVMFHAEGLPRSSIIIYWITAVAYIALSRYLARGVYLSFALLSKLLAALNLKKNSVEQTIDAPMLVYFDYHKLCYGKLIGA